MDRAIQTAINNASTIVSDSRLGHKPYICGASTIPLSRPENTKRPADIREIWTATKAKTAKPMERRLMKARGSKVGSDSGKQEKQQGFYEKVESRRNL